MQAKLLPTILFALFACSLGCQEVEKMVTKIKEKVSGEKTAAPTEPKPAEPRRQAVESGTIALLVASEGYQDEELKTTRSIFVDAGFEVAVLSFFGGRATGALGGETVVDKQLEDVLDSVDDYVAVVLVGGPVRPSTIRTRKPTSWCRRPWLPAKSLGPSAWPPSPSATLGY